MAVAKNTTKPKLTNITASNHAPETEAPSTTAIAKLMAATANAAAVLTNHMPNAPLVDPLMLAIQSFRDGMARFNAAPEDEPLRILVATDAAREGINLQDHCADLFHIDLPWNPARVEQRNGRIDRTLQPQVHDVAMRGHAHRAREYTRKVERAAPGDAGECRHLDRLVEMSHHIVAQPPQDFLAEGAAPAARRPPVPGTNRCFWRKPIPPSRRGSPYTSWWPSTEW